MNDLLDAVRGGRRKVVLIAVPAFLVFCWLCFSSYDYRPYTCAVCRMDRVDQLCLGHFWSSRRETDCSRWYSDNIEPVHEHDWAAKGRCRRFGIPFIYEGYACTIGTPITMLGQSRQIEIYQHFEDPLEARRLFESLARRDGNAIGTLEASLDGSTPAIKVTGKNGVSNSSRPRNERIGLFVGSLKSTQQRIVRPRRYLEGRRISMH